jgi:hypothetical protein
VWPSDSQAGSSSRHLPCSSCCCVLLLSWQRKLLLLLLLLPSSASILLLLLPGCRQCKHATWQQQWVD